MKTKEVTVAHIAGATEMAMGMRLSDYLLALELFNRVCRVHGERELVEGWADRVLADLIEVVKGARE